MRSNAVPWAHLKNVVFWNSILWMYTYMPMKCTHFKLTVQWVLTNTDTPATITSSKTEYFLSSPTVHLTHLQLPPPETSGLSKNWFAFCHYRLVVTFLEYQRNWILFSVCQAFFVQHDVFKHHLYSDVHQWFISLCWWVVIPFPPLLPVVSSDLRLEHLKEWDRGKGHFIPKQVISILYKPECVLRKPLFSVG